jgi:hypothetical protein
VNDLNNLRKSLTDKNVFFINVAEQSIVPQKYAPYPDKKSII